MGLSLPVSWSFLNHLILIEQLFHVSEDLNVVRVGFFPSFFTKTVDVLLQPFRRWRVRREFLLVLFEHRGVGCASSKYSGCGRYGQAMFDHCREILIYRWWSKIDQKAIHDRV